MNQTPTCDMELLTQAEFDGELDASRTVDVETHRAGCARCQAVHADLQRVRTSLRADATYYRALDALRRSLREHIGGAEKPAPIRPHTNGWAQRGASFGLGAAMAAAIALFVVLPGQEHVLDDVVASHVRSLQPGHLQDVVSTDQHTVKPWFDGKLDFAPPVKDLKEQGFPLEGGRLDYLEGRPVAALVYGRAKHQINLFAWPTRQSMPVRDATAALKGYNAIHIVRDGMNLWFVSDLERTELAHFVQMWDAVP